MDDRLRKIRDANGNAVVFINDIIFKGKRNITWNDVKEYVKKYIGSFYEVAESKDVIYIDKDFPDEFANSKDTRNLRGTAAKAKANSAQAIQEIVISATHKRFTENKNRKHNIDAKYGWYRYDTRVAIPVFYDDGDIERYNIFHLEMLIRHDEDRKLYLYDLVNIKKETSNPPKQ